MKEKKITIGLIGLGTVGFSVFNLLNQRKEELLKQHGINFYLKMIMEKDKEKIKKIKNFSGIYCQNIEEMLNDPEIDTVVELIGGIDPAKEMILKSLKKSRNVVTGNKQLLAVFGDKLFKEARKNNAFLGFRAAMTGCHSVLNHLQYGGMIKSIIGVFNGTTNFILSQMDENNMDFSDALKKAQELGFAEKNPSLDIEGRDTAHKAILITRLAFMCHLKPSEIYIEGIKNIDLKDMEYAKEFGYTIKLLGIIKKEKNTLEIRIHPCLIPNKKAMALIKGAENSIEIIDDARGVGGLIAEGAGGNPAASAIVADLIDIANDSKVFMPDAVGKYVIKKISKIKSKYYFRFNALNKPGVLGKISTILARHNINIKNVTQKGDKIGNFVPVIIITYEAQEREVQKAIKKIDNSSITNSKTKIIRIEENII
jgi:homoserine dehydrogenase